MKTSIAIILILFTFTLSKSFSQSFFNYSFEDKYDIPVIHNLNDTLKMPWIGGLNSPQFGNIDLNMDGIKDLIIFEGDGDFLMPFINDGITDSISYSYAPEYKKFFPDFDSWVQFIDYNCDGKNDIFTYYGGGIRIYQNTSTGSNLKFTLKTPYNLLSYYYNGYVNLYLSNADYPAIADIDNDGDLDILTFQSLGTFVHYHKNLSMENYGNCDSLDYELWHECWGYFAESDFSNTLLLGTSCGSKSYNKGGEFNEEKHVGSSLRCIDIDGDNDKEMILGDVDYSTLFLLHNSGTVDSAYIDHQDTIFPSYNKSVRMPSMPNSYILDIDNDSVNEMIISPFDPSFDKSFKKNSVWYYENTGSNQSYTFSHQTDALFQQDMIDVGGGAYPVIYDFDKDGLKDIILSNYGTVDTTYFEFGFLIVEYASNISFYKNVGTTNNPAFRLMNEDIGNLSQQKIAGAAPTFGDIDGDGDDDMIVGDIDGTIHLYTNTAGSGQALNLSLSQANYQGIDVGKNSKPQLVDLNKDALLDLVIGERYGTLYYYENTGTSSAPIFTYVTDSLGYISVSNLNISYRGYSSPCFFLDSVGNYALFVGSLQGYVSYFNNIEGNLTGSFNFSDTIATVVDSLYTYTNIAALANPTIGDINNDGYLDLIIGSYAGGLRFLQGRKPYPLIMGIQDKPIAAKTETIRVYPNPAQNQLTIINPYSTIDLIIYDISGKKVFEKRTNSSKIKINISNLSNGFYILKMMHSKGIATSKFIIQR